VRRLVALAVVVASASAHADPRDAAPTPSVDVADLPPLPERGDDSASSATMLAAAAAEEDVVVGAAKREQSLGNVASAVTVISGDRLRRFGYRTVGEALGAVAGVYLVDNRDSYTIGIRGLNIPGDFNTRILVLVDGASINEAWGSFAGLGFDNFISIDDIARIELIRGPVSSLYGANAFFGIVNIVTRGAAETPRAWARTSINSVNGSITSAGFAQGNVRRQIRGTVQFMNRIGDTTSLDALPGIDLKGDASNQLAASIVGTYDGSFVQIRGVRYRRDSPFAPFNGDPTVADPFQQYDTQVLIEGGHTSELTKRLTLAVRGYANIYEYADHIVQAPSGTPPMPLPPFDDFGDAKTFGAEVRARYELWPARKIGVTGGGEASFSTTKSHSYQEQAGSTQPDPSVETIVPQNFDIEGVYAELDGQPLSWLGFTGGVRFDRNSVVDKHVSPRAALFIAKPEKYGVKLLYAQGFRNPSAYEKFFFDGVSFLQSANPDGSGLHAETIQSYEGVVWAKPIPGIALRASAFSWDARDIVTAESVTNPATGMPIQQFQNAKELVSTGFEFEGSYRDSRGWYGFAGATYAHVGQAELTNTIIYGTVPNAPAFSGAFGLSTPKLFGRVHLSSELVVIGQRSTRLKFAGDTLADSPPWYGWNAVVYMPAFHGFDVTIGVRNIIGTRDLVIAPPDYDRTNSGVVVPYVPGEGREFFAKVGYSY
jgi:iron complex outermembrane receptor protein